MPDGCLASAHQKYIQSSRVRWFITIILVSLARIRSPHIATLSPSSFSTSAYRHNAMNKHFTTGNKQRRSILYAQLTVNSSNAGNCKILANIIPNTLKHQHTDMNAL